MRAKSDKASHKFKASIIHNEQTINDVFCEIFLPQKVADPIELCLRPTMEQSKKLQNFFEFSIEGEIKGFNGEVETRISGQKIYSLRQSTMHWGSDISETVLIAEPIDLKIIHFLSNSQEPKNTKGTFWLTPSIMLPIRKMFIRSYTGETKLECQHNFEFALANGLHLKFDHYYRYLKKEGGATESFPELVAEFELESNNNDVNMLVEALDDFLMLISFAARQRCVCLGWETFDESRITKFYRRNITIPEHKKDHSFNDAIIDPMDFDKFINIAYKNFTTLNFKDLIRQAVNRSIGITYHSLESTYLTLYSALETLIMFYRQNNGIEFILPPSDWTTFKSDVKNFIKSHSHFVQAKGRRQLIYDKLDELNRISFSSASCRFFEHYNINLDDLWPTVERKDGISLADVRNKLIHGDTFNRLQKRALIAATEHLRWIVERSLLAVLGWPIEDSKVREGFLSRNMIMHREWQEDRKILT